MFFRQPSRFVTVNDVGAGFKEPTGGKGGGGGGGGGGGTAAT